MAWISHDVIAIHSRYKTAYTRYAALWVQATDRSVDEFLAAGVRWPSGAGTKAGVGNEAGHTLVEYSEHIDLFYELSDGVAGMPIFLPFELFLLDCSHLNKVFSFYAQLVIFSL